MSWEQAARINFELKRKGQIVRSNADCLIAQIALENGVELIHNDRDFDLIATIRPLKHLRLDLKAA
jgi:predicted nucleic acid-binding protein